MRNYSRILFLFCFLSVLSVVGYSQQINQLDGKGKKTGLWETKYANDSIKSKGYYKDGKAVGLWTYYYDSGELMAYMEHLTDGVTCNFKLFDPTGPRIAEGLYLNGKKDGEWHYYGIDSSKVMDETYIKGLKTGEEKVYYPKTGKLFQTTNYKDGKKNGWWKQFYPDGILKTDGTYANDTLNGKSTYYHTNGKKNLEGNNIRGLRDGEFFVWDDKGKLIETLHYKMGILDEKDLKRHLEPDYQKTYPEDVIYQGGFEQYNPNYGGGGGGGY
jgi:antitoxin component YwqK of YwqJK toxin-antitoxin module